MAKRMRRSFGKFFRGAVKDVVMPTSVGLGLAIAGCGSSESKSQDGSLRTDLSVVQPDAQIRLDTQTVYAVMPPAKDAATADTRPDSRVYAIMPPRDAAADTGEVRRDAPIYAIMPMRKDAGDDATATDAESVKPDAKPDTKALLKDTGPIYAIMPLAVLPPRG